MEQNGLMIDDGERLIVFQVEEETASSEGEGEDGIIQEIQIIQGDSTCFQGYAPGEVQIQFENGM